MTYPLGGEATINLIFLPTFPKIHIKFGLSAGKMACTGCTPKFATAENDYIGYLFNKQPSQYKARVLDILSVEYPTSERLLEQYYSI